MAFHHVCIQPNTTPPKKKLEYLKQYFLFCDLHNTAAFIFCLQFRCTVTIFTCLFLSWLYDLGKRYKITAVHVSWVFWLYLFDCLAFTPNDLSGQGNLLLTLSTIWKGRVMFSCFYIMDSFSQHSWSSDSCWCLWKEKEQRSCN